MLPGESKSHEVAVKNGGSREADFYVQLLSDGVGLDLCNPNEYLNLKIDEINGWGGGVVNTWYNASVCPLYPGFISSIIPQIADDVGVGEIKYFRATVTLNPAVGNSYQGLSNTDTIHLIAVQYNGPAPVPNKQNGVQDAWPADTESPDDDPNYP
jgi:hypothetical protein